MNTVISNKITVSDPIPELTAWANRNLNLPNPEYTKKMRLGYSTWNTPQTLTLYERHGNRIILPFGTLREILPYLRKGEVYTDFCYAGSVDYGKRIPLYDYQTEALEAMKKAKYGMLESAAGSGKTQIGIALIQAWGTRALWLCHTADLLRQSKERAERYIDKSLMGTITEGKVNIGKGITFATVQTMVKLNLADYRDMWDVVIVDEAHRVSGSPTRMTQYSKVLGGLSARHKYGLTATPDRSDGLIRATKALLGEVVYKVPDEAVADKIMKVGIKAIATDRGLDSECLNEDGTLNYTGMITSLCKDEMRNLLINRYLFMEKEHSCLILSDRLEQLAQIMNNLPPEMREKAVMIDGKMTSKKEKALRENALEQMRTGEKQYLFATYALAKEGLDVPRLDRLFLATPQKYHATVVQSIGRIARTFPGKEQPIAYDFVDNRIPYCMKAWKERCTHYRKAHAFFVKGE